MPNLDVELLALPAEKTIKVFAEYDVINHNLHHSRFEVVESPEDADILWLMAHFKDFR